MGGKTTDPTRNPFTAQRIAPGTISYLFADQMTVDALLERLAARHWRGQIVGPHGSGKSTLLRAVARCLQSRGHDCRLVTLSPGQRALPPFSWPPKAGAKRPVLLVDGYEQLGLPARWRLRCETWFRRIGLLVTTHRPAWLPVVYETRVSLPLAQAVVDRLCEGYATADIIRSDDVAKAFAQARGDLRETLFQLYDVFELRRREVSQAALRSSDESSHPS